jgi:DNA-binding transcriptional LysR family regulator
VRIRQLEYFVAIVEAGSYSAAARELFVAQPSLSQQIRSLELELGGRLLERTARGVAPTSAGQVLLDEAREVLLAVSQLERRVHLAIPEFEQELVVATVRSIAIGILPRPVATWRTLLPSSMLRIRDFTHRRLVESAVATRQADVAVAPRPDSWDGEIDSLGYEEILMAVPDGADPAIFTKSADAGANWVLYEQGHGLMDIIEQYCRHNDIVPCAAARTAQVETALELVGQGVGATLVPGNIVPAAHASLTRPCSPRVFREITAYTSPRSNPMAGRFMGLLRESALGLLPAEQLPADAMLA